MHVTQFLTVDDFIHDIDRNDTDTAAVYQQRTAVSDYGTSQWQLTTVVRALVASRLPAEQYRTVDLQAAYLLARVLREANRTPPVRPDASEHAARILERAASNGS